jgi:hypothetical protein
MNKKETLFRKEKKRNIPGLNNVKYFSGGQHCT